MAARHKAHVVVVAVADLTQLVRVGLAGILLSGQRKGRSGHGRRQGGGGGDGSRGLRSRRLAGIHLVDKGLTLDGAQVGATVEPQRVLLPGVILILPVLEAAAALVAQSLVALARVVETGVRELCGGLAHAERPARERVEARGLHHVRGVGRARRQRQGAALVTAQGHVAHGLAQQEGALRGPTAVVGLHVVSLRPLRQLHLAEVADQRVAHPVVVEAIACGLLGAEELGGPGSQGAQAVLLPAQVVRGVLAPVRVVSQGFLTFHRHRGQGFGQGQLMGEPQDAIELGGHELAAGGWECCNENDILISCHNYYKLISA